ncbi:MAG TPA: cation:proton antiporter [Thermoanaerobaculia bacterium]|jgi:Kef-type K+ transport system membrane component KefB
MKTRALLTIAVITALTYATRSFVPAGATITGSGAALAFGFLLIAAVQAGYLCDALKMPRLTGYIVIGLLFGPEMLGLISAKMLPDLALVKGTAVGLIAFLAGCELNLSHLRPKLRAIGTLSLATLFASALLLFALLYAITHFVPITADFSPLQRAAVALVCANVLAAFSPAVVVGIISETKAKGPLSEMALSIVVLADLVIVVTYALSSTAAHAVFPSEGTSAGFALLVPHIFGSILAGAIAGALLAAYVVRVSAGIGLVTFAILFIAAEAGHVLHLNPLLVGLAAGMFLENVTPIGGERLTRTAEPVAMPVFAIFFAVVGAEVQLRAFLHVAPFALAACVVRFLGIWLGARLSARAAGIDAAFARRLTLGLLPQAGVAIALASLMLVDYAPWGRVMGTVVIGTIVVNQLIGPVLFRNALVAAGETSAAEGLDDPLDPPRVDRLVEPPPALDRRPDDRPVGIGE